MPLERLPQSLRDLFEQLDRPAMCPLPAQRYEFAVWKRAKINIDYYMVVDGHSYSAPVALVRQRVDVRLTEHTLEVLHNGERVAVHARSLVKGAYSTCPDHRSQSHRGHADGQRHPQEHYRDRLGIVRLAGRVGTERMERPPPRGRCTTGGSATAASSAS